MEKDFLKTSSLQKIESNFSQYTYFLNYEFKVFDGLQSTISEICQCLMLGLNKSAITLSNYFSEKMLKLALIYNKVGIAPINPQNWNDKFGEAENLYGGIILKTSIDKCYEFNLITQQEKETLINVIKNIVRNGFSHADGLKILKNAPSTQVLVHGRFDDLEGKSIKFLNVNQKVVPFMQAEGIDLFAEANALPYFKKIFQILVNIEQRLSKK